MATPGFQQTATPFPTAGYNGDLGSAKTIAQLNTNGYVALGDVVVGSAVFLATSGTQVSNVVATAGTNLVAGIVYRNAGRSYMSYAGSEAGYSNVTPNGSGVTAIQGGDVFTTVTGVSNLGVDDHIPNLGDTLIANQTNGTLACVAPGTAVPTGFSAMGTFKVTLVALPTFETIGVNQSFCQVSGNI